MADFLLYVLKLNVLAALLIVLIMSVSGFLSKKYSVWWRSWIWLAVSLVLLVPVQLPDYWNVIHIQIPQQVTEERISEVNEEVRVQGQEGTGENLSTENSLAASENTDLPENTAQSQKQGIQMPSLFLWIVHRFQWKPCGSEETDGEYYESGKVEKRKIYHVLFSGCLCIYECDDRMFGKRAGRYLSGEYREREPVGDRKRYVSRGNANTRDNT